MRCMWSTLILLLSIPSACTLADDWPQWLGPGSASEWREEGIKTSFDDGQLQAKWTADCSYGYAGPAVADGKVYVFDYKVTEGSVENNPGRPVRLEGAERLHCIDAATGEVKWTEGSDVEYYVSYPGGPRAAPCVAGDRVYTLGTQGDLTCRDTADGKIVWHVNYLEKFGTETPIWGHSSCPLVIGDLVYTMVGGEGTAIVAFNRHTGEEAWRALSSNQPGYSSPVATELNGKPCVVAFHPTGVTVLDAVTGEEQWGKPIAPRFGMAVAVPRRLDERMFVSAYGEAMMVDGVGGGDPTIIWKTNSANEAVYCSNSPPYFADDVIFGCDAESSELIAIDPGSGDRLWGEQQILVGDNTGRQTRHGTAFIVRHTPSGRYFLFNEVGELIVADLTREGIEVHGRNKIIEPTNEAFGRDVVWMHPAFADGCVFARNDKQIVCVSLKE